MRPTDINTKGNEMRPTDINTKGNEMRPTDILDRLVVDRKVSKARRESLARAIELGASAEVLIVLRDARRLRRADTIFLPPHHLEGLSRGRGWCRMGRGDSAVWGERTERGYLVGPGKWIVGGNDGFARKRQDEWRVKAVQVGTETWTIAE